MMMLNDDGEDDVDRKKVPPERIIGCQLLFPLPLQEKGYSRPSLRESQLT